MGAAGASDVLPPVDTEARAKECLRASGLPVLQEIVCQQREAAVRAAAAIGYPVVAKIVSADITHKTEVGGVVVNSSRAVLYASGGSDFIDV